MNKVKPQVGQVWRSIEYNEEYEIESIDDFDTAYFTGSIECATHQQLITGFEFVPQSDLEWLAVNVEVWVKNNFVYRASGYDCGYGFLDNHASITYTRQQWQNMRYKLGLDKKPGISGKEWAQMLRNKQEKQKND